MVEYIERAAVETMLENAQIITDGEYCGYCTEDINLGSIPAADVVEVMKAKELIELAKLMTDEDMRLLKSLVQKSENEPK